jgi:hypothetical protein
VQVIGGVVAMQMPGLAFAVPTIVVRMTVLGDLGSQFQMSLGFDPRECVRVVGR